MALQWQDQHFQPQQRYISRLMKTAASTAQYLHPFWDMTSQFALVLGYLFFCIHKFWLMKLKVNFTFCYKQLCCLGVRLKMAQKGTNSHLQFSKVVINCGFFHSRTKKPLSNWSKKSTSEMSPSRNSKHFFLVKIVIKTYYPLDTRLRFNDYKNSLRWRDFL